MVKDYHESFRALQGVPYACNFWHGFRIRARIFFRQKTKNFRFSISFTSISINKNGKDSKNRCFFETDLYSQRFFWRTTRKVFLSRPLRFGFICNLWCSSRLIWSFDYYYMTWYLWVENLDGNAEVYIHREFFPKCEGTLKCALNKFYWNLCLKLFMNCY